MTRIRAPRAYAHASLKYKLLHADLSNWLETEISDRHPLDPRHNGTVKRRWGHFTQIYTNRILKLRRGQYPRSPDMRCPRDKTRSTQTGATGERTGSRPKPGTGPPPARPSRKAKATASARPPSTRQRRPRKTRGPPRGAAERTATPSRTPSTVLAERQGTANGQTSTTWNPETPRMSSLSPTMFKEGQHMQTP